MLLAAEGEPGLAWVVEAMVGEGIARSGRCRGQGISVVALVAVMWLQSRDRLGRSVANMMEIEETRDDVNERQMNE